MRVKICGISTPEAADAAVQAGTDFIGFVFASSKRQITPFKAQEVASFIPSSVKKVGVFVNESIENVKNIAEQVGLDIIQLHGEEAPEYAKQLDYPVIKAFSVNPENMAQITHYPCSYYLLDSPIGPNRGGNGTTFDWKLLQQLDIDHNKIILAGGLKPENIQEAIKTAKPVGVDVSSGVETDGQKDIEKINQFIKHAKGKDETHGNIYHAR